MKKAPGPFRRFVETYPECGMTYEALAAASREAAGFPEKDAELLKLALARRALEAGATAGEVRGVALLGLTTLGLPHSMMGTSWIEDVLREAEKAGKKAGKKGKPGKPGKKRR
ncbi:MAG TPA: carboxymuconolactone decarboxylase family protein [Thermoanaerobaculia bacterium]|nr:carboxymuconolactone decarboxylase family protein [Thermoanaerobaculia bacterium]